MDKSQRQKALIQYLKTAHFPVSLTYLAAHFDCSMKTLRRDLKYVYYEQNAPWFVSNNKVYQDTTRQEAIELQSFWFGREELESLFALNQIIEELSPGGLKNQLLPFKKRLDELLTTQGNSHPLSHKIKLLEMAGRQVDDGVFQTVIQALAENKRLHIRFWNRYIDETRERVISPQKLVRYRDNWLLDAYCHWRKALRSFSLETIQSIELTTQVSTHISSDKLDEHFQSSYGIYAGKADKKAVLKFSPYLSRWVQSENWHPNQVGQWDLDGSYQLTLPYENDTELVQEILKYGEHLEVLEPQELRDKIQQKLKNALHVYAGTGFVPEV